MAELVPRYGSHALSDLLPSVLASLDVEDETNPLGLDPSRRVAVLLVDGLGLEQLRRHAELAPFLASLLPGSRTLTVGFPATTATSLASLGTGRPPAGHGMLGYQVRVPGEDRLLNALFWDTKQVDPRSWQPTPTAFQRAADDGVAVTHVAPGFLRDSGLTQAALRGARFAPAETAGERAARTLEAMVADDRTLTYCYYGDLDGTGHRFGVDSEAWRLQLAHVDTLVQQVATRLPAGTTLLVTADHGMIDVPQRSRYDADALPALAEGVAVLGGEGRARHVYARPGAERDVLAAWRETLGVDFDVLSRDEAVAAGWFGPDVADWVLPRVGDAVAAAADTAAVVATKREPLESGLVGMHGSLTAAEQLVPLLEVRS